MYIRVKRHPLLHSIAQGAEWTKEDEFPAAPEWADEHERWLAFVEAKGELARFIPRLKKNAYQRDRTFSEIGIAYYLEEQRSLPIIEWEPTGNGVKTGEYLVQGPTGPIFVEVKTAGWQKDIMEAEGRQSPRLSQPKYINAEARSVAPWAAIRNAIANAYPKFASTVPSLLVIRDDYSISLDTFNKDIALFCPGRGKQAGGYLAENGYFLDSRFERLGGIAIIRFELGQSGLRYNFFISHNPNAVEAVKLPSAWQ
jgi:hypothetical protein